ncbi:MAG TPA: PEP-CTERM sorting domain-containing protein [Fimbriimonadaceae bacterium]|jgi:hypothetical protein
MNKLSAITFVIVVTAVAALANTKYQCTPEPVTMLALIPGVAMFIRRRKQA